jgi:hypothetical protein
MVKRKKLNKILVSEAFSMIITLIIYSFAISFLIADVSKPVSAATSVTTCCEKTKFGEWCQNTLAENCDSSFQATPTSCDATSFCKTGCCYSSIEGTCDKNTPKKLCESRNGTWSSDSSCDIPQCQLGCCVLMNDAFLSTQVRCKQTSAAYGLNTDWRGNIQNELECIYQTELKDVGACVYEEDFQDTCRFTSREECLRINPNPADFHKDILCSAEELGTNCGPSDETTCVEGKDEVYFIDTCGNTANIYDASKRNIPDYWKNVVSKEDSCKSSGSNILTCGNCNYFTGSVCKQYSKTNGESKPKYGNNICRDLNCYDTSNGKDYKHGESWCVYDGSIGNGTDIVGSRHWRHLCIEGEEKVEPCADYRQDICIQEDIPIEGSSAKFSFAACRANDWRSCIGINSQVKEQSDLEDAKKECLKNSDCYWFPVWNNGAGDVAVCLPKYPSGYQFGPNAGTSGEVSNTMCSMANQEVQVTYVKNCKLFGLLGSSWDCAGGCAATTKAWTESMNKWCTSLGDCGAYVNIEGVVTDDGYSLSSKFNNNLSQAYLNSLKKLTQVIPGRVASGGASGSGMAVPLAMLAGGLGAIAVILTHSTAAGATAAIGGTKILGTTIGKVFGSKAIGGWVGPIIAVAGAYFVGTIVGKLFGLGPDISKQLGMAGAVTAAGLMIVASQPTSVTAALGGTGSGIGAASSVALAAFVWAVVVIVVLAIIAKLFGCGKQKKYTVKFECKTWQPPVGGADCEKCNNDPFKPCSEYRCSSLGAACQLVNSGTGNEKCVWVGKDDAKAPIIKPWDDVITDGYRYSSVKPCPPGPGCFEIKPNNGKACIPAYTPITFGISTDEVSQCNFDVNRTGKFEQMQYSLSSGLYMYNHSITLTLPDPAAVKAANAELNADPDAGDVTTEIPLLSKDGKYNFYMICRDANGNANTVPLAMSFCVEPGPDRTPPKIIDTSIKNGAGIGVGVNSTQLVAYLNEPAECRWSKTDYGGSKTAFNKYENNFTCQTSLSGSINSNYPCYTTLTEIAENADNNFYFLCKDQPTANESSRNIMSESYKFVLKGTIPLEIESVEPTGTISAGFEPVTIELKARTINGYDNGKANCFYSYIPTNIGSLFFSDVLEYASVHEQSQSLAMGDYTVYFTCLDGAGNNVNASTSFTIAVDNQPPRVIRAYRESSTLKIATNEDSTCVYSIKNCNYAFENATQMTGEIVQEHSADWRTDITYYIKCADAYGNMPAPASCSLVAHGYEIQTA